MNPILRNILVVIVAVIGGSIVNMAIVMNANVIFPLPSNVDPMNMESIKMNMHLYGPEHFIMPFLAHALGTLVAAFIVSKYVTTKHLVFALALGAWFLIGGIANAYMLPAPLWFEVADVLLAYFPMAYLGAMFAKRV